MNEDQYHTLSEAATGEFRDRGSKFIAYAYPASTETEWQERLEEVRKLHPKARHHCYAFRLGMGGLNFRANDDGEPSGTAGRPILGQIDRLDLTNVIVVVIRYFGGTKLGTSGLINAYRQSTASALESATIIEKTVEEVLRLAFDYSLMSDVMNAIKKLDLEMVHQSFEATAEVDIAIPKSQVEETLVKMRAAMLKISMEQARQLKSIAGLNIQHQYTR